MAWPVQPRRSRDPAPRSRPCRRIRARDQGHQPAAAIPQRAVSSRRRGARPRDALRPILRVVIDGAGARDDRALSRDASRAHRGSSRSSRPFNGSRRRTSSLVPGDPDMRPRPPRPACPSSNHPRGDLHPLRSARCPPRHLRELVGVDSHEWRGRAISRSARMIRISDLSVAESYDHQCRHGGLPRAPRWRVRPRGEKADEPCRLPFRRGNGRKVRGNPHARFSGRTRRNPWKSRCFRCRAAD